MSALTSMKMLLFYFRPKSAPEPQFTEQMTDIKALFAVLNSREDFFLKSGLWLMNKTLLNVMPFSKGSCGII